MVEGGEPFRAPHQCKQEPIRSASLKRVPTTRKEMGPPAAATLLPKAWVTKLKRQTRCPQTWAEKAPILV